MKNKIHFATVLFLSLAIQTVFGQTFTGKPKYEIRTTRAGLALGNIYIELFPNIAPKHTRNFDSLVNDKFFDTTAFHRVIPGFMIQGGDPNSRTGPKSTWGYGDPSQVTVPAEFTAAKHLRGRLSAARDADTNSANSQFFICVAAASWLDGDYSVYGQATSGMNWVDTIVNSPRDINDCPYQKIEMFVTYIGSNDSVPASPTPIAPANYLTNVSTVSKNISWSVIGDAILYRLDLSLDSTFSSYYYTKQIAGVAQNFTNLPGYSTIYWRVMANNGGHFSAYSPIWRFTTQTGAAALKSPLNASTNVSVNPVLVWDTVQGGNSYRLQVATSSTFTAASIVLDQPGIADTTFQVTGLNPSTLYYWRIKSAHDGVEGAYSAKWSFTTSAVSAINNILSKNDFNLGQNIPNPCDDVTSITYSLPSAGHVVVKLFDLLGREISVLEDRNLQADNHTLELNLEKIKSGIYFYKIETGSFSATKKLRVQH
jgi:peptidyl-prolyl cis-trans isomerase B (cyclophilin B)